MNSPKKRSANCASRSTSSCRPAGAIPGVAGVQKRTMNRFLRSMSYAGTLDSTRVAWQLMALVSLPNMAGNLRRQEDSAGRAGPQGPHARALQGLVNCMDANGVTQSGWVRWGPLPAQLCCGHDPRQCRALLAHGTVQSRRTALLIPRDEPVRLRWGASAREVLAKDETETRQSGFPVSSY